MGLKALAGTATPASSWLNGPSLIRVKPGPSVEACCAARAADLSRGNDAEATPGDGCCCQARASSIAARVIPAMPRRIRPNPRTTRPRFMEDPSAHLLRCVLTDY